MKKKSVISRKASGSKKRSSVKTQKSNISDEPTVEFPDIKLTSFTVQLGKTQQQIVKEAARFQKMDLIKHMTACLTYRSVEILCAKKGFLRSARYKRLFCEVIDLDQMNKKKV